MANEKIYDIIAEVRGVFEVLRKYDYEVVSLNRMESIIGRIEAADEVVRGQKLLAANNRECEQLNTEIEAMSKFNDALNAQMQELAAECVRLRSLVKEMLSHIEELFQCENQCDGHCLLKKESCELRARRELIARAREVAK